MEVHILIQISGLVFFNSISKAYKSNKKEFTESSEKFTEDLRKIIRINMDQIQTFLIKSLAYELKLKFDIEHGGITRSQNFYV